MWKKDSLARALEHVTTEMKESFLFFFNAKVTLFMRFRKLALTMIAKKIRSGTMEARAVRGTGRSEFRFATHCLRDGPHTGLCGSIEIWF